MSLDTLSIVAISLAVSFLLGELCFRIKYPRVIGQIITGIILGLPFIRWIFNEESIMGIGFLADIGIIFLLLLTGMQINLKKLKESKHDTTIMALFSVIVPFILGFIVVKGAGYNFMTAFVVGSAICLTAEGTKLKVLLELGALNTRVGVIMLGAGILDDLFEVILVATILVLANESYELLIYIPIKFLLFITLVVLIYKLFPKLFVAIEKEHSRVALISLVILFGIIFAVASEKLGLGHIIGAFIAGIIINMSSKNRSEYQKEVNDLEAIAFSFIVPFFFINIGIRFDIFSIVNSWYLTATIFAVAIIGKLAGAMIAKIFTNITLRQAHLIGWGLNSRGAIEIVIAEIAYEGGLIPVEIYSALIFVAIVTTIMFPFILRTIIKKDRTILTENPLEEKLLAQKEAEEKKEKVARKKAREEAKAKF